MGDAGDIVVHATTIAVQNRGLLITGAAGSGKSSLALALMALGADLVADDRTALSRSGPSLLAQAPKTLHGLIEARGIGILRCPAVGPVPVHTVIDLDQTETQRLPPLRYRQIAGIDLPCLHKVTTNAWPSAIIAYLTHQRIDPDIGHVS